jgi:hypothetical protein
MATPNDVDLKTAIVVSHELPLGLAVNAASVLSVTLGVRIAKLVGDDVTDAGGRVYPGIVTVPLPVLQADPPTIARIVDVALHEEELFAVPFSSLAQSCRTYDEYVHRMSESATSDLSIVALALVGPKKHVNRLVGSLPLLR